MSAADVEAGFLQLWQEIKPSVVDPLAGTKLSMKSLMHDAYVTGWLDAELHQQENSNEEGFSNVNSLTQGE